MGVGSLCAYTFCKYALLLWLKNAVTRCVSKSPLNVSKAETECFYGRNTVFPNVRHIGNTFNSCSQIAVFEAFFIANRCRRV